MAGKDSKRPKHFCDKVTMASTLGVAGAVTMESTLDVASFLTVGADAAVAGTVSCAVLCAQFIDWSCQANAEDGIYKYPGPGEFEGGNVEFKEGLSSSGGVSIGRSASRTSGGPSLTVAGPTTLEGPAAVNSTLSVKGESTFNLDVNVSGGLNVVEDSYFDNDVYSRGFNLSKWRDYISDGGEAVFQKLRTVSDMHCGDTLTAHIMNLVFFLSTENEHRQGR